MSNYWRNKKVFVTGINGFVGGNLCKALIDSGAQVFGLIRNRNQNTFISHEKLESKIRVFYGDLCDKDLISQIISEEQINSVFHLAAQVEVGVGMANPFLTLETNVRGTYTLLESCRLFPSTIESIVIASSDKAYGSYPVNQMPYKEDYPLKPRFPYDTSKACGDLIAQAYANDSYGLPIVVTRFCNIYGPGQLNFSAVVPDGFRSALGYSEFVPRSDGSMTRDFLHVQDVSELYLRIGETLAANPSISGQIFNAGPNEPISVKSLLKLMFDISGNDEAFKLIERQMEGKQPSGEIDYQSMDFEKVFKYFGWSPTIDLSRGLKNTLDWYSKYLESISTD
jgi:CDP-glucose 4,6-dehydratase